MIKDIQKKKPGLHNYQPFIAGATIWQQSSKLAPTKSFSPNLIMKIQSTPLSFLILGLFFLTAVTTGFDICKQPKDVGPCKASKTLFYYNTETSACEEFTYGGCSGNSNKFKTKEECESMCGDVCKQPMDVGPCRGAMERFYYNAEAKACQEFIYGGCKGTGNNFKTQEECQSSCVKS